MVDSGKTVLTAGEGQKIASVWEFRGNDLLGLLGNGRPSLVSVDLRGFQKLTSCVPCREGKARQDKARQGKEDLARLAGGLT